MCKLYINPQCLALLQGLVVPHGEFQTCMPVLVTPPWGFWGVTQSSDSSFQSPPSASQAAGPKSTCPQELEIVGTAQAPESLRANLWNWPWNWWFGGSSDESGAKSAPTSWAPVSGLARRAPEALAGSAAWSKSVLWTSQNSALSRVLEPAF